jgi:ATP-dependent Clp protease adaptor protein ClpS
MVTRNTVNEKREHALSFTFRLAQARSPQRERFRRGPGDAIVAERSQTSGGAAGMTDSVVKPRTKVKTKTERPKLHKVILVNDDYTPREFVVTVLKAEFRMSEDQAHKVMITAHRRGVCVVAVFTKDVAETKATRATDAGRAKGYPLLFTTEPEE